MSRPHAPCRLCGVEAELCESHLIPKFVFRWLKRTGADAFRRPLNPNRRAKDGAKLYLLCEECEGRFGRVETYFCKTAFTPTVNGASTAFKYDADLYTFAISLFWRRAVTSQFPVGSKIRNALDAAELRWKPFLLDPQGIPLDDEVHMVVMRETPGLTPTKFWNTFLTRGVDLCVAQDMSDNPRHIFAKLGPFQFYTPLGPLPPDMFSGTEVSPSGGHYKEGWTVGPSVFDFLVHRARDSRAMVEQGLSSRQRERIRESMIRAIEHDPGSPHAKMLLMDLEAEPELPASVAMPGRNGPCFCGSGKKYKKCHGSPGKR